LGGVLGGFFLANDVIGLDGCVLDGGVLEGIGVFLVIPKKILKIRFIISIIIIYTNNIL